MLFYFLLSITTAATVLSELLVSSTFPIQTPSAQQVAEYNGKYIYTIDDQEQTFVEGQFRNQEIIVEQNSYVTTSFISQPVTSSLWNLDILDNKTDSMYTYDYTGKGVTAYVVDSGITESLEFGDRIQEGISFVEGDESVVDCLGHGTHVSSLIGSITYGVAKGVFITPVRVFGCDGRASTSVVVQALYWIITQKKGVVNMSLGGPYSSIMNNAIKDLVDAGFVVVVAAGNDGVDACNVSPASEPSAVTAGCLTQDNQVCWFSNEGTCVTLFSAGNHVLGLYLKGKQMYLSGTSMSTPAIAAESCILFEKYPNSKPDFIKGKLISNAARNTLTSFKISSSPNLALRSPTNSTEVVIDCRKYIKQNCPSICSYFPGYGCRIKNFCGFRTKRECTHKKRCAYVSARCIST